MKSLLCIEQQFEPTFEIFMLLGNFSFVEMAKYWKNKLTIWSHWLRLTETHWGRVLQRTAKSKFHAVYFK